MNDPEELPKLRLAPKETPADLTRRFEHEQRAVSQQREQSLGVSLAPYRVGSVPYLNGVPLIRGIEDQISYAPPARLAEMLRRDELDAALVSVVEVLLNDRYDVMDGVAIASLGEIKSVLLAHRRPIQEAQVIYCDPASLTSVQLLRLLLAEQGLHPKFDVLPGYNLDALPDFALLIGDVALDLLHVPHDHMIWDLGTAWYELTQLPFVYAVWAIRRGLDHAPLCRTLREARDFGLETLDTIIAERTEYTLDFRRDYLGWHVHYHLAADERRGLARFIELLRKHGSAPVYPPRFVSG